MARGSALVAREGATDGRPAGPQDLCKEIPEPIGPANIHQGSQRFILSTVEPLEPKQKGISGTESRYGPWLD